jgi:hypothetical protein
MGCRERGPVLTQNPPPTTVIPANAGIQSSRPGAEDQPWGQAQCLSAEACALHSRMPWFTDRAPPSRD